jgi:hypothetical protein
LQFRYNPNEDGDAGWTAWTTVATNPLSRSAFATAERVELRFSATATAPPSQTRLLITPVFNNAYPSTVGLSFVDEVLYGVTTGMEFRTLPNGRWVSINTNNEFSITTLIPARGTTEIEVRIAQTENTPASLPTPHFTLTPRPAGPVANQHRFNGIESHIANTRADIQFLPQGETDWIDATGGNIPVTPGDGSRGYRVRVAPTTTSFASSPLMVSVPGRPVAPIQPVMDASGNNINRVTTHMEFRVDRVSADINDYWVQFTGTSLPISLMHPGWTDVEIRFRATAGLPASQIRHFVNPN